MSEMIERVAAALYPSWFQEHAEGLNNYPNQHLAFQEMARKQARAAIEAMREPTDDMIEQGQDEVRNLDVDFSPCQQQGTVLTPVGSQ